MAEDEPDEGAGDEFAAPDVADEARAGPPVVVPPDAAPAEPGDEARPVFRGTGVSAALVIGVVLAILAIIVAFQNTDDVRVDFLTWRLDAPLVVVILAAAVAGVLMDEILGFFWRRRRRRQLAERAELRRLRRR